MMGICGRIVCSFQDVSLSSVLRSGQSFRWVKLESDEWVGPLGQHLWILHQDEAGVDFRVLQADGSKPDLHQEKAKVLLEDYFQLSVSLPNLYKTWSDADEAFRSIGSRLPGVRMLRQDPVENLFCFICSSNNNIQRITSMVEKLCERYGDPITQYGGRTFHSFPSVSALSADGVESELRQLGFGYRARYIGETARQLRERGGEHWLHGLREVSYTDCHAELRKLCGVGAKVADCVCLMSLDQACAVPVDTHVHQLAARHYLPQLRHVKTLTDRTYREVADHFRKVFGDRAGWAQAVLFCGDLNEFKDPPDAPKSPQKSAEKKSAKSAKKPSLKSQPKSVTANRSAESVTPAAGVVPVKRRRTTVVGKGDGPGAAKRNASDACERARSAPSAGKRGGKRRSKV